MPRRDYDDDDGGEAIILRGSALERFLSGQGGGDDDDDDEFEDEDGNVWRMVQPTQRRRPVPRSSGNGSGARRRQPARSRAGDTGFASNFFKTK